MLDFVLNDIGVRAPGEEEDGFDDRVSYEEAVSMAKDAGERGKLLLEALEKMKS